MALCLGLVFDTLVQKPVMDDDVWTLADRLARNREIAGLHYRSDTVAGRLFARCIVDLLKPAAMTTFNAALAGAKQEWQP
jgi:hypothetical protein